MIDALSIQVNDTFRFNLLGSPWLTATGFRGYRNAQNPELEAGGLAKVISVVDERGRRFGITVRPGEKFIIKAEGQ